ncbi:MAG: porin family protein [Bacteroidota bacterium]
MKTILLSIIFLFPLLLWGQLSIGAKGGINIAKWQDDKFLPSITRSQGSAIFEVGIRNNFFLDYELGFIQKGSTQPIDPGDGTSKEWYYTFNYLDLSVLLKYSIPIPSDFGVYIAAGPSFSYAISGESDVSSTTIRPTITKVDFEVLGFRRTDFSVALSSGLSYQFNRVQLFTDVRYLIGLTDLIASEQDSLFNRGLGITIGGLYLLRPSKKK